VAYKPEKWTLSDEGKKTRGKAKNYLLRKGKRSKGKRSATCTRKNKPYKNI